MTTVINAGDPVELIRKHQSMYVSGDDRPLADKLLLQVFSDAIALGVTDLVVSRLPGWTLMGSDINWFSLGAFQKRSLSDPFEAIIPLVEAGRNAIRHEIVVRALATKTVVLSSESERFWVKGNAKELPAEIRNMCLNMNKQQVIGFCCDE